MIVVSDAGPLHYLVWIESDTLLPRLFGEVVVPPMVLAELRHPNAPARVRDWASRLPSWIVERTPTHPLSSDEADPGEAEAIALAKELGGAFLSDDARAMVLARREGLLTFGTLGVLQRAHAVSLLEIEDALRALSKTNHHHTPALFERVIREARAMRTSMEADL